MIGVDTGIWIGFLEGDSGADAEALDGALQDRQVLAKGRKARLGDALIAQCCIDRGIPLLTRDRDFRAFAHAAGLNLVIGSAAE